MKDLLALTRHSLAGLRMMVVLTLLLGLAYPLLMTVVAQVALPWRAGGSLVTADGQHTTEVDDAVGSALVGQLTDAPDLFHARPSVSDNDMLATGGSNLGPESPDLVETIHQRRTDVAAREGVDEAAVPPDAVTASASGLDPHISVAYAELQAPRVAAANGLSEEQVQSLVRDYTAGRGLGVLGEPRVNVLLLNIAVRAASRQ